MYSVCEACAALLLYCVRDGTRMLPAPNALCPLGTAPHEWPGGTAASLAQLLLYIIVYTTRAARRTAARQYQQHYLYTEIYAAVAQSPFSHFVFVITISQSKFDCFGLRTFIARRSASRVRIGFLVFSFIVRRLFAIFRGALYSL